MSDKLKPCPFCGGRNFYSEKIGFDARVGCGNCGAKTRLYNTDEEAIVAWNRRVETSPFKKYELEFIIKVLLHDSVAKQTVDIMRVNIISKCQKLIKDSPLELLSVDKIALDRLLKRG